MTTQLLPDATLRDHHVRRWSLDAKARHEREHHAGQFHLCEDPWCASWTLVERDELDTARAEEDLAVRLHDLLHRVPLDLCRHGVCTDLADHRRDPQLLSNLWTYDDWDWDDE